MLNEIAEEKTNMADTQGKEDVEKDSVSQKKIDNATSNSMGL